MQILSESFQNLSKYLKYPRTSENDPGLCASNLEARSKYLKYPSGVTVSDRGGGEPLAFAMGRSAGVRGAAVRASASTAGEDRVVGREVMAGSGRGAAVAAAFPAEAATAVAAAAVRAAGFPLLIPPLTEPLGIEKAPFDCGGWSRQKKEC